jgi:hypothetical protein
MSSNVFSRFSVAAIVAASLVIFSSFAHGYVLEGPSWPAGSVVALQMELGSAGRTLQDGTTSWNDAAAPAPDEWNAVIRELQYSKVMNSNASISSGDGVNSVAFSSTVFGDSFGSGVLAVTTYLTNNNKTAEADVLFNKAQEFDSYRGNLQFGSNGQAIVDIRRVLLHELGHALGLDHPDQHGQHVDAIMNSVVSNTYLLTADDIAGAQHLYGAAAGDGSPTPSPTPASPSRLVNLSTRMRVGTGENVLIGGFIIQGDVKKKVLLRALGPSLGAQGIAGALQDPQMTLLDSTGAVLQTNDNWQSGPDASDVAATGIPPTDPREAAIVARLVPGSYTVVVSGVNNTTGIAMVENYTLDTYEGSHVANISTRGYVGVNEDALIGGFIVRGSDPKTILLRALGPSLGGSTTSAVLIDPLVELHDSNGDLLATNDDWQNGSQAAAIRATGIPPSDPRESALISTLNAGNYTAVVRGAHGGSGIGLVEIYDLNP